MFEFEKNMLDIKCCYFWFSFAKRLWHPILILSLLSYITSFGFPGVVIQIPKQASPLIPYSHVTYLMCKLGRFTLETEELTSEKTIIIDLNQEKLNI